MSFIDDIQGKNTQLYPIVTIEPPDGENRGHVDIINNECIFISTNNTNLDHIHVTNAGADSLDDFKNIGFNPLLLNIPSIKESIDIESRKFKISNVSLDISNIEYEGKRFTDILADTSLINWRCSIQFVSPSAKLFSTIFGVQDYNGISFFDAYYNEQVSTTTGHQDKMTQMVYQGIIRRISHDDTKVKIELEDLTEKKAHKNLPQALDQNGVVGVLGGGESIPDKYKNKPIPMVYGHVDRSPVVVSESFSKYQADSKDIKELVTTYSGFNNTSGSGIYLDPLQVDIDGEMHHIKRGGQYPEPIEGDNSINLLETALSGIVVGAADEADSFEEVSLTCRKIANPKFSITNPRHDTSLVNYDFLTEGDIDNINAIADGSLDINPITLEGLRPRDSYTDNESAASNNNERLLLSLNFDVTPNHDTVDDANKIIGFRINGYNLPQYLGDKILKVNHINGVQGDVGDVTSISPTYDNTYNRIWDENIPHYTEINNVFGFTEFVAVDDDMPSTYYNTAANADIKLRWFVGEEDNIEGAYQGMSMPVILFSGALVDGGVNNTFSIQFRIVGSLTYPTGDVIQRPHVELDGNINEIGLLVENQSLKLFNKDFYANVKGRINTHDDHPDEDMQSYEYQAPHINFWTQEVTYTTETSYVLIQNPIDIIYDLVRSELGHDAIDEAEYKEAKDAHNGWKFGFTINKKINSKKLIEDIAKSTKCFPKFKNDGTFGFNTIKDSYTVSDIGDDGVERGDYNTATLIKESEVISYSFKKTKPEQIVSEVGIKYKKDYAQDSYLKDVFSYIFTEDGYTKFDTFNSYPDNWGYYGIDAPEDAFLDFESDYIRDDETAHKLRGFLFEHNQNNHLIFNLKLPLQYINLEIGDLVKFRDLFNGVKAYGIDYRRIEEPNGQYYYPLFMVTATTKNLDSVSIECMQLHHLSGAVQGESDGTGWFEGTGVGDTEGLFYFPDSDPIVIAPPPPDEEVSPDEGDQVEVLSGHYSFEESFPYGELVFIKEDGVLLFDFTAYSFFSVGNLIRIRDNENNVNEFEILYIYQSSNADTWRITLKPKDIEGLGELIDLTSMSDSGDLLITELSWLAIYQLGDANLDGGIDILDIATIMTFMLGTQTPTLPALESADINQDNSIDILDIVGLVHNILGID